MSFQLVIAEKPSVARSIAAVIGATEKQNGYWQGGGYLVSWCIGHLVSFAEAGQYDEKYCKWRYEDLPILPQPWQFIVPDEKKQQFEVLRALLNRPDVDSVTAATDAGREGELIFRFVYQMAGCTKPVKRLWISSMEDAAIREGFANLRPDSDYDALYQSALCRAKADWLVGINATRLFSVLYHKNPDGRPGADPDTENAGGPGCKKFCASKKEKVLHSRHPVRQLESRQWAHFGCRNRKFSQRKMHRHNSRLYFCQTGEKRQNSRPSPMT